MEKYKKIWQGAALAALFSTVLGLTGCATGGPGLDVGEEVVVGRTTFSEDASDDYMLFPEYRIAPGDLLDVLYQVKSWVQQPTFRIAVDHKLNVRFIEHPELNETQYVRPDGKISLAYIGSVDVVGKSVDELTKELKERYKEYLKDAELYIVVEDFRSAIKELKKDLMTAPRGLSRLVTVRPDGYATFAMIGDIYVAGKTVPQMSEVLNERYEGILPGLSCDLFLEKHSGTRVSLFGEVNNPGAYQILRPTSIFEALAMAGSVTPAARLDSVIIFRQKKEKVIATRLDLKKLMSPVKLKKVGEDEVDRQQAATEEAFMVMMGEEPATEEDRKMVNRKMFYLYPDDIVYIPRRRLNSAAQVADEVSTLLFFRGWGVGISGGYDLDDNNN